MSISSPPELGALPGRRYAGALLALGLLIVPDRTAAHEFIPGVTGFPAALLHPLLIFDSLVVLIAAGLVLGQSASLDIRLGVAAMLCGLAAGFFLPFGQALPGVAVAMAPLTTAGIVGVLVASAAKLPPAGALAVTFALGVAVGANVSPEANTARAVAEAIIGVAVTSAIVIAALGLVIGRLKSGWARIGVRIVGSWIAASTIMVFAFVVSRWSEWTF